MAFLNSSIEFEREMGDIDSFVRMFVGFRSSTNLHCLHWLDFSGTAINV
jgi:hypothetical protein